MPYIVSTLANSQKFVDWVRPEDKGEKVARPAVAQRLVLIKGGADVQGQLRTPEGVITSVSADDLDFLQSLQQFNDFVKRGHFKVVTFEANPDKVAQDLIRDTGEIVNGERISGGSAQLSIEKGDFEDGGRASGVEPTTENPTI